MNATRIIAIRHGETDWNLAARLQGHTDIALNATGLQQARQMAAALADTALSHIYSSDLLRAWETAQALASANGAALTRDARLRERSFGEYEGQRFIDIEAQDPDSALRWRKREPAFTPPGGESLLATTVPGPRRCVSSCVRRAASGVVVSMGSYTSLGSRGTMRTPS